MRQKLIGFFEQKDVFFDYTKPEAAKTNCLTALQHGAHVIIGTSGLTYDDYAELALAAKENRLGLPGQTLSLRHDSGSSAQPYVGGGLLAIRKVSSFVGLRCGLDSVLDLAQW